MLTPSLFTQGTRSLEIAPAPELATRDVRVEHVEPRDASFGYLVPKGLSRDEKRDYCSKHGYGCFCSSSGICAHACCLSSEEVCRPTRLAASLADFLTSPVLRSRPGPPIMLPSPWVLPLTHARLGLADSQALVPQRALHGIEAAHLEARDGAQDKSKSTMSAFVSTQRQEP